MSASRRTNIIPVTAALLAAGVAVALASLPTSAREPQQPSLPAPAKETQRSSPSIGMDEVRHAARRACGKLLESEPRNTAETRYTQCMDRMPLDGDLILPPTNGS